MTATFTSSAAMAGVTLRAEDPEFGRVVRTLAMRRWLPDPDVPAEAPVVL